MDPHAPISMLLKARRILVLGPSGSGKSHFCSHLAKVLGIRCVHLDACFWKPGWVSPSANEWNAIVRKLVADDSWIMDGTYERTLKLRVPFADIVILIESRRSACLWRVVRRKLIHDRPGRVDAPPGQPINWSFLRYMWQYPKLTRPLVLESIKDYCHRKSVLTLKGPKGANLLLQHLQAHVGSSGRASITVLG